MFIVHYVSYVMCHMSCVTCHVSCHVSHVMGSHVMCHMSWVHMSWVHMSWVHMSCVTCHVSPVTCYLFIYLFFYQIIIILSLKKLDKRVELVGGGSVINGAYPVKNTFTTLVAMFPCLTVYFSRPGLQLPTYNSAVKK